jgi:hypothetical protein
VRRHRHRVIEHGLGALELAGRLVGLGQPVVGVDEFLVAVDQLLEDGLGLGVALAHEQGLGQAQARPRDRLRIVQLLVDRLGLGRFAQEHVQLGAQAHEVDAVARIVLGALDAAGDRFALVARFHQLVHRHEHIALFQRARDTLEQAVGREWLEDVVGRGQFGGRDHLAVIAFGRDHEEHGRERNEVVVAQVFEQLLAILAAVEVVFAQNQVERLQAKVLDGVVGAAGVVDLGQAAQVEHIMNTGPHAGMGLNNQGREPVEFIHLIIPVLPVVELTLLHTTLACNYLNSILRQEIKSLHSSPLLLLQRALLLVRRRRRRFVLDDIE